jgi:uncharacterized membrane protein
VIDKKDRIDFTFRISLFLKGIFACVEIVGGFLIFFISQKVIISFILNITQEELTEDPKDILAHALIRGAEHLSISAQHFAALYLIISGCIKIILVTGLLKQKRWAYPVSLFAFGLLIVYELIRFDITGSFWLLILILFDSVIVGLIWYEYKKRP